MNRLRRDIALFTGPRGLEASVDGFERRIHVERGHFVVRAKYLRDRRVTEREGFVDPLLGWSRLNVDTFGRCVRVHADEVAGSRAFALSSPALLRRAVGEVSTDGVAAAARLLLTARIVTNVNLSKELVQSLESLAKSS
ncbi:MAG: hypothetical protein WEB50_08595 [Vicinamibacterales bacterium]